MLNNRSNKRIINQNQKNFNMNGENGDLKDRIKNTGNKEV